MFNQLLCGRQATQTDDKDGYETRNLEKVFSGK